jgi:hypothetical protein
MGRLTGITLIKGLSRSALALYTRDRLFASGLVMLRRVDRLLGLGSLVAVDELRGRADSGVREVGNGLHDCSNLWWSIAG